jgi:arylsulfatase A-like enzyme
MMADDLGWGDLQCFNPDSPIQTPCLDQMAAAGMQFQRFYAAAPVCSPTRGSCLTGRHPYRYGVYYANVGHLRQSEQTLSELLGAQGYATGHFGKWHLGTLTQTENDSNRGKRYPKHYAPPWEHGFARCFSTEAKVPTWDPMWKPAHGAAKEGWKAIEDRSDAVPYGTHYWNEQGQIVRDNLEGDDSRVIMDRVLPFIEAASQAEQPFFAVIWFHAPHLPVVAGPKYAAQYADYDTLPQNYYGCVTAMDEQVGRLRAALREGGVAQNTLLWFASDNGPEGSAAKNPGRAGPFSGRKRSLREGGIRVPGIIEWPAQVAAGATTDFPAVTSDYLPTLLEILDVEPLAARPLDGISLLPVLAGRATERTQSIGFQSQKQRALITQQYKLLSQDAGVTWQLFDLLADPSERTDLAARHPDKVAQLSADFQQWQASCQRSDQGKED